jgi:adenosylcobinamide-phosphate synthase
VTLWGVLLALAWEQVAPLFRPSQPERLFGRYADWIHDHFNAGTHSHGLLAWAAAALAPALAAGLIGLGLAALAWPLGLAWSALVLYRCLGYRQAVDRARAETGTTIRSAMDQLFRLGLERLFGVLFWFVLLGVFGALGYALTRLLGERWQGDEDFHAAIEQVVPALDWAPARLMAMSFAIVGNFEAAVAGWRTRFEPGASRNEGVIRAAGLGALGLDGEQPGPEYLAGVAGLLNRSLLLWLAVLGLFWLGGL